MTSFRSVFRSVFVFPFSFPSLDILLLLVSFAFLSLYSADFGVLSSSLARFSRLALRLLLLAFFGFSVAFFPAYFRSKPSLWTWVITISSDWQSFTAVVDFPLKKRVAIDYAASHLLLTTLYGGQLTFSTHLLTLTYLLTSTRPREALV